MSKMSLVPDRQQRQQAETTFDRNVVVVAGAGTGKTTLLVNRLIHLVIKEPDPVPMTSLVALTFTNKAATEMKVRLRERLQALVHPDGANGSPDTGAVTFTELRDRYALSRQELVRRAEAALHDLEQAQIGTLHSFAAHLLRLYPLESGIDPSFQEDDGSRFEEHFAAMWEVWLGHELSRQGTHHDVWRSILRTTRPDELRLFARALCSELIELSALHDQLHAGGIDSGQAERLKDACLRGTTILASHAGSKPRKAERMLGAAVTVLRAITERGPSAIDSCPAEDRKWLGKDLGTAVRGWDQAEFQEASQIIDLAAQCLLLDHGYFKDLLKLVLPPVSAIRETFVRTGWVSFDGLLARARTLLRDHPTVRERVKKEYRAVLVDEFQDTDPVQYEMILAISERAGQQAARWVDMELEPGKLCIVGDPKQSIYAFRRADIEAFDRVVQKIHHEQGIIYTLTTNFRSDAAVLGPVNDLFDRIFERRPHVQPANIRLEVRPQRRPATLEAGVRLHLVKSKDPDAAFDAAGATRAEAETLARWLADDLLRRPSVKPGQVALLFRKLTQADLYLDALRRHGIAYVIDGEKHFYRRQEVIDVINILRLLENPHDHIALVGVLRAPIGGLTDREVYELRQARLFDYRRHERLASWPHPRASHVHRLYRHLATMHEHAASRPLADVIQDLYDRLPLLELAAASLHGEQAVANLFKVKQVAAALADRPSLTLSGFVDVMVTRLEEEPDEAESPLAEDSVEAVQVMTIHKAKGLEFPVVVLPGLHQGTGRTRAQSMVVYDWSSGLYGLSLGDHRTFGSIVIQDALALRESAERRRVLYVGMTRAKELLLLSGGMTARSVGDSVMTLLAETTTGELGERTTEALTIGESSIPHVVLDEPSRQRSRPSRSSQKEAMSIDLGSAESRWKKRTEDWAAARSTPLHLTPTDSGRRAPSTISRPGGSQERDVARLVGICAHRILERWDFTRNPAQLTDGISTVLAESCSADERSLSVPVEESLRNLFALFGRSPVYTRLRTATILGREVPFVISWNQEQVMEGVIDVIYRLDGGIWVADYKSDVVADGGLESYAERYRTQAEIYREAVRRTTGSDGVGLELIFLRSGVSIQL